MRTEGSILIAGAGNLLRGDDGVGVHALRQLQQQPMPGVVMVEIGTAVLHALSFVASARRLLLIDAARGGRPPGTIYVFDASEPVRTGPVTSLHSLGLREAIRLLAGAEPPPITVIGVEPLRLDYGLELSAPVRAALPRVVELARASVWEWQQRDGPRPHPSVPAPVAAVGTSISELNL